MLSRRSAEWASRITPWALRAGTAAVVALAALASPAHAQQRLSFERVEFPSLNAQGQPNGVNVLGYWRPAPEAKAHGGAIVLLHGCGGPYSASAAEPAASALSQRMKEYTALLQEQGWAVLITDSLTPRGERELCTQRMNQRRVTQAHRRQDVWAALQWLSQQSAVDARRLGLVGWSHGGSAVLAATDARAAPPPDRVVRAAFAVSYYPGCSDARREGYQPVAPLLMMVGALDDWTPPEPCQALVEDTRRLNPDIPIELETYEGAYHGFDGTAPVRHRRDVPNGVNPGAGVHVGGHPPARALSQQRLRAFLNRHSGSASLGQ